MNNTGINPSNILQAIQDPKNWKRTQKKSHNVYVCRPLLGVQVVDSLCTRDRDGRQVTDQNNQFVVSGVMGETKVIDARRLAQKYKLLDGQPINNDFLLKNSKSYGQIPWKQLTSRNDNNIKWAFHLPPSIKNFTVQTPTGTEYGNIVGVPHLKGDFIVCDDAGGRPSLNNMEVVNGEVFPRTYDLRSFRGMFDPSITKAETVEPKQNFMAKELPNSDKIDNKQFILKPMSVNQYKQGLKSNTSAGKKTATGADKKVATSADRRDAVANYISFVHQTFRTAFEGDNSIQISELHQQRLEDWDEDLKIQCMTFGIKGIGGHQSLRIWIPKTVSKGVQAARIYSYYDLKGQIHKKTLPTSTNKEVWNKVIEWAKEQLKYEPRGIKYITELKSKLESWGKFSNDEGWDISELHAEDEVYKLKVSFVETEYTVEIIAQSSDEDNKFKPYAALFKPTKERMDSLKLPETVDGSQSSWEHYIGWIYRKLESAIKIDDEDNIGIAV